MSKEPILKVKDLGISFSQYTNGLVRGDLNVIRNLDIELYEGEILAVFQLYTSAFSGILRTRQPARSKQVQFHARFCLNFNKFIREKELKSHESIYG